MRFNIPHKRRLLCTAISFSGASPFQVGNLTH